MQTIRLSDVEQARKRIAPAIFRTPLVRLPLDTAPEEQVFAKAENLQRTGSFKLRGAFNFLSRLEPAERAHGVVTHSSGNHAQGVACAARLLGIQATVVIPEGAPEIKVERTRAWGATIVRCKDSMNDRYDTAREIADAKGATLVPPFDHPWIVAGQGTAGLEIVEDLNDVQNVLVCVGGGGLISGIATVLATACPEAQIIGVEPELAADAAESFETDRLISWSADRVTRTLADGVRTQRLGELNFSIIREHVRGFVTVSEDAIREATRWYALEAKLVVEPTGALTLAAFHKLRQQGSGTLRLKPGKTVLLISGGNIDPQLLASLLSGPGSR